MFKNFKKTTAILLTALLLLASLLTLASCSSNDGVPKGYQLIACDGDNFRLYVPTQGWMPNTAGGVSGAFYSSYETVTVSVHKIDGAGEMTLSEYWTDCQDKLSEQYKSFKYLGGETKGVMMGGKEAQKHYFTADITVVEDGKSAEDTYKFLSVIAKYEGDIYMLVYNAPEEQFDNFIEDVEGNDKSEGIIPYFEFAKPYAAEEKEYSDKADVPEGMKLISTDELPYRFFVPDSWTVNDRAEFPAAYVSDSDSSNVNAHMYMSGSEEVSVEAYFADCEKRYKELFQDYVLVSSKDIEMDGASAKEFVYTFTSGGVSYKQLQAIVLKGAVYYTVTYTSTPESFDEHLPEVNKMIESFDIR